MNNKFVVKLVAQNIDGADVVRFISTAADGLHFCPSVSDADKFSDVQSAENKLRAIRQSKEYRAILEFMIVIKFDIVRVRG